MAKQQRDPADPAYKLTRDLINWFIYKKRLGILGLSQREEDVITMRWAYILSMEQIAQNQSVSKERAGQIYYQAIMRFYIRLSELCVEYPEKEELYQQNKILLEENERYKRKFEALSPEIKKEFEGADILLQPIEELELSIRARTALSHAKVKTVNDLLHQDPASLLSHRNFGVKSMSEIELFLHEHHLKLIKKSK